jgi:hypothetical protein
VYFFRKRNVEVRETTLPTKYTREMMCYFTPFDFDVLDTCHEVASFFVSFVDLSEVTSQKEQQMTRRWRLPRGMYLVNINVVCFDVLMYFLIHVLMYVLT